jgi:FtsZ-binding cell division protein ZapB
MWRKLETRTRSEGRKIKGMKKMNFFLRSHNMKVKSILFLLAIIIFLTNISVFSAAIPEVIRVKIQIDNKTAKVNDKVIILDAPPTIINNKTFVPLRFISEAFGATVQWDSTIRMITIDLDNPEFYQNKVIEMETEIGTLNETIRDRDATIKNLNTELKKKNSEISSLKEKNSNLENDIVNLKSEIESLKTQLENLKNGESGIEYKNIQIIVDGKKIDTMLEPFIYKGKVFASLEDICAPLGKTFKWDSQKNIFYIESIPEDNPPPPPPEEDNNKGRIIIKMEGSCSSGASITIQNETNSVVWTGKINNNGEADTGCVLVINSYYKVIAQKTGNSITPSDYRVRVTHCPEITQVNFSCK